MATTEAGTQAREKAIEEREAQINVGDIERILSLLAGGGLAVQCLVRRTLGSALLGYAGAALIYRGLTGYDALYRLFGINTARGKAGKRLADRGFHVERAVVVDRPVEEVYRFWRKLENLPRFMTHLESVRTDPNGISRWAARGPLGAVFEWKARTISEKENELIAWESLEGSDVDSVGTVRFERAPGGRGTIVRVNLKYNPPAGSVGRLAADLFGKSPERQIEEDLRHFKQILEAGEISTTEGQPHCF